MILLVFSAAAAIVGGTLLSLLSLQILLLVLLLLMLMQRLLHYRFIPSVYLCVLVLGLLYGHVWLQQQLQQRLPSALDRSQATLRLAVTELEARGRYQRIQAQVLNSKTELRTQNLPPLQTIKVSVYPPLKVPAVGAVINAQVVLRSPRNFANGLSFDYEALLLSQGINATGYVQHYDWVEQATAPLTLRYSFLEQQRSAHSAAAWTWIAGLIFGEQSAFAAEQWRLSQRTGTLHLLVVSGMHLSFMLLLGLGLWALWQRLTALVLGRSLPALIGLRACFLLSWAGLYLWLAGSGIALQRAWLMLLLLVFLQSSRLRLSWATAFAWAVLLVLVVNPLIWTGPGFGYSFLAVAALLLFFYGRKQSLSEGVWLSQWVVFSSLVPLFLFWYQPVSLMQCVANLAAIPWVNLVLMPLALLNVLFPDTFLASWLVMAGDWFWQGLLSIENIPLPFVFFMPGWALLLWPVWLLLIHQGLPFMHGLIGVGVVLLALFLRAPSSVPVATMLDVGQGQALVFTSENAALVYDAGPKLSAQYDTGDATIRPYLMKLGVSQLDLLVISHADNDHAGGAQFLAEFFRPRAIWGGQILSQIKQPQQLCQRHADEWIALSEMLLYRFLSIPDSASKRVPVNNNNLSCVMQLRWYGTQFLLVGDIGRVVEFELLRKYGAELKSDILVLAHHGSGSSSTATWLDVVSPKQAWISSGFNNRFGHPHPAVIARLEERQIPWLNTAQAGAVRLLPDGQVRTQRAAWQPPWRQP